MSLSRGSICLFLPLLIGALSGCDAPTSTPEIPKEKKSVEVPKPKVAFALPKKITDVPAMGIPVFEGSVLPEEADSVTVDEHTYFRTYKIKMYAPAEFTAVSQFYMTALKESRKGGMAEFLQVNGKSTMGDSIEVRLGPAADHKKTLVMVWMTQSK